MNIKGKTGFTMCEYNTGPCDPLRYCAISPIIVCGKIRRVCRMKSKPEAT